MHHLAGALSLVAATAAEAMLRSMKGQQKPKKLAKKAPQKSLKERRATKQAAAKDKRSTSGF